MGFENAILQPFNGCMVIVNLAEISAPLMSTLIWYVVFPFFQRLAEISARVTGHAK